MFITLFILIMAGVIPISIFTSIISKLTSDRRKSDAFKLSPIAIVILVGLCMSNPEFLGLVALILLIRHLKKKKNERAEQQRAERYGWNVSDLEKTWTQNQNTQTRQSQGSFSQTSPYERSNAGAYNDTSYGKKGKGNSAVLSRSVSKRKKVLSSFNEKFSLYLTDEQIQSIVNSSYMSEIWKVELEAMTLKYETVYEWFQGKTDWLRAYMYVFHVQEITSDIRQQEKICIYAYEEVFRYVDELGSIPLYEKIQKVNKKFLTSFDDVSFMIAYRFLESKGLYHTLESPDLVRNDSEIDELLEKYKTAPSPSQM